MQAVPAVQDVAGPEGQGDIFKSPESGSQGMFLGGDPSYVQKDAQLIKELGLNFKFVSRRRGAGPGGALDAGVQAEEADPLLLVHAAVPEHRVRARPR